MKTFKMHLGTESGISEVALGDAERVGLELSFVVEDTLLAQKWFLALKRCLEQHLFFEKNYFLLGLPRPDRTLQQVGQELESHLSFLMKDSRFHTWFEKCGLQLPFHSPLTRLELNQSHHLFEILIGQVWSPSEVYLKSNSDQRHSIRQINHLVHEYEQLWKGTQQIERRLLPSANMIVSFLGAHREPLPESLPVDHVFEQHFGDVFLHYAQLGKTHLEVFLDQDHEIFDSNITNLRYLTGEFDVYLGQNSVPETVAWQSQKFSTWLKEKGVDPDTAPDHFGRFRVARLDKTCFEELSPKIIHSRLRQAHNLTKIELFDDEEGLLTSRRFHYPIHQSEKLAKDFYSDFLLKRFWTRLKLGSPLHL